MSDEDPVEPSAILTPDGRRIPYAARAEAVVPAPRGVLSRLTRAATAGPVLAASALALAAVAAAKAGELAGRMAWQAALGSSPAPPSVPGRVEISWTHVEIRWTP